MRYKRIRTPQWALDMASEASEFSLRPLGPRSLRVRGRRPARLTFQRVPAGLGTYVSGVCYGSGAITLNVSAKASKGYRVGILLHELAHHHTPWRIGHGPEFYETLYILARHFNAYRSVLLAHKGQRAGKIKSARKRVEGRQS
jgi:hypothetical protein